MSVRLTSPTVLARIEKGKQLAILLFLFPSTKTCMGSGKVVLLEHVRLLLVKLGCNDKVLWNDRVLVQNQEMSGISGGNVGDEQVGRRVVKRVRLRTFWFVVVIDRLRLLCQCWTVAELKLKKIIRIEGSSLCTF